MDLLRRLRSLPPVLRLPAEAGVLLVGRPVRPEHGDDLALPAARRVPAFLSRVSPPQPVPVRGTGPRGGGLAFPGAPRVPGVLEREPAPVLLDLRRPPGRLHPRRPAADPRAARRLD